MSNIASLDVRRKVRDAAEAALDQFVTAVSVTPGDPVSPQFAIEKMEPGEDEFSPMFGVRADLAFATAEDAATFWDLYTKYDAAWAVSWAVEPGEYQKPLARVKKTSVEYTVL